MMIIENGSEGTSEESEPPGLFYPLVSNSEPTEMWLASIKYTRKGTRNEGILQIFPDRAIANEGSKIFCLNFDHECYFTYDKDEMAIEFRKFEEKATVQFKTLGTKSDFENVIDSLKCKCPQQNFFAKYQLKERKGKGKHGEVYLAQRRIDHHTFAIKIRQENSKWNEQISILKQLQHPNLVYLQEYFIQPDHTTYTVMDYQDGGNLYDKIYINGLLSYKQKLKIVIDMLNVLQFLRINDIVHRDIKPQNILYSNKDKNYKLADFGLAIRTGQKINKISGTPGYLDPEILQKKTNDYTVDIKSDIYSMGLTFYQIFTGTQYYQGRNSQEMLKKNSKGIPLKKRQLKTDDEYGIQKKLLQKMIRTKQNNRKNSYEIMTSSIFNKITRLYCEGNITHEEIDRKQRSSTSEDQNIMSTVKKLFKIKNHY